MSTSTGDNKQVLQAIFDELSKGNSRPFVDALKESAGELRASRPSSADLLYKLDRLDAPEPFSDKNPGNYFRPEIFGVTLEFIRVEQSYIDGVAKATHEWEDKYIASDGGWFKKVVEHQRAFVERWKPSSQYRSEFR